MSDLPRSESSDRNSARGPVFRIYRSEGHVTDMALNLKFETGLSNAETWLSIADARWLAERLTAHCDAFEAQFTAEVAA